MQALPLLTEPTTSPDARLPDATHIGAACLAARDPEGLATFYVDTIGMTRLATDDDGSISLGVAGDELLVIEPSHGAPPARDGTNLFHIAYLVPTRADLGGVLKHLAATGAQLTGASDHTVSEALYLQDPEDNGIEIYRDRPVEEWKGNGDVPVMGTFAMDVEGVAAAHDGPVPNGLAPGTKIGHVHLFNRDGNEAEQFFGTLGMDLMVRIEGFGSFLSAGRYHHHIGARHGYGPVDPDASGLRWYELLLPGEDAVNATLARAEAAGHPVSDGPRGAEVLDPSGHRTVICAA